MNIPKNWKDDPIRPHHRGWTPVSASYKTHTVLLIYTVKSGQSLGSDIGKKNMHKK